jgi:hypothetical protein
MGQLAKRTGLESKSVWEFFNLDLEYKSLQCYRYIARALRISMDTLMVLIEFKDTSSGGAEIPDTKSRGLQNGGESDTLISTDEILKSSLKNVCFPLLLSA